MVNFCQKCKLSVLNCLTTQFDGLTVILSILFFLSSGPRFKFFWMRRITLNHNYCRLSGFCHRIGNESKRRQIIAYMQNLHCTEVVSITTNIIWINVRLFYTSSAVHSWTRSEISIFTQVWRGYILWLATAVLAAFFPTSMQMQRKFPHFKIYLLV